MSSFSNLILRVFESAHHASEQQQQSSEEKAPPTSRLKRKRTYPGLGESSKAEKVIVVDEGEEIDSEEDDSDVKRSRAIHSLQRVLNLGMY